MNVWTAYTVVSLSILVFVAVMVIMRDNPYWALLLILIFLLSPEETKITNDEETHKDA